MNQLPEVAQTEKSVLAGCLLYPEMLEMSDSLIQADFYSTINADIFKTITDLRSQGIAVDSVSVLDRLADKDNMGTLLAKIMDTPVPLDMDQSIKSLKDRTALRRGIKVCSAAVQTFMTVRDGVDEAIDKVQGDILAIGDSVLADDGYSDSKTRTLAGAERYDRLQSGQMVKTGILTGFVDLDQLMYGFQPGHLIILAARPRMGKSAIAVNMAVNMAKQGDGSLIISLEMPEAELHDRMMAGESRINSTNFVSGNFFPNDRQKVTAASDALYNLPIFIAEDCYDILPLCRKIRLLKKKKDIKIVFVDHLQLTSTGGRSQNRNYELADITKALKRVAKELKIPIVLLSQLNRACELRENKRPILSDLRDAGAIEQDADVVLFLHREEVYILDKFAKGGEKTESFMEWEGKAELRIAKGRSGPERTVYLTWLGKITTFENQAREEYYG